MCCLTCRLILSSFLVQISSKILWFVYTVPPLVDILSMSKPSCGALFWNFPGFSLPFSCLTSCQLNVLRVNWRALPAARRLNRHVSVSVSVSVHIYLWCRRVGASGRSRVPLMWRLSLIWMAVIQSGWVELKCCTVWHWNRFDGMFTSGYIDNCLECSQLVL